MPSHMATWRPILALVLATFVAVGLSLSAVHASGMPGKMDMMLGMERPETTTAQLVLAGPTTVASR